MGKTKATQNILIVKHLINSAHFAVYKILIFCPMVHTKLEASALN